MTTHPDIYFSKRAALLPALFFLVGWFVFSGCKRDEFENTGYLPDGQNGLLDTTAEISAKTMREDSVLSSNYLYQLLGKYNDPVFGVSEAGFAAQFNLSEENPDLGNANDIVVDSVNLYLGYDDIYGELTPQGFNVYLLREDLDPDADYYSDHAFKYDATEIGGVSDVTPDFIDSLHVRGENYAPGLKIPLYKTFGVYLLSSYPDAYSDNASFQSFFKGLLVKPVQNTPTVGDGGIISFDLTQTGTFIRVFYRYRNAPDTWTYDYTINNECARVTLFDHDYSRSAVNSAFGDLERGKEQVYVQSMAGSYAELKFGGLKALFSGKRVVVNNAELILPVENERIEYPAHDKMFVAATNELGEEEVTPDQVEGESHFGGRLNENTNEIRFTLTQSFQQIADAYATGGEPVTTFHLIPGDLTPGGAAVNANRTVLAGPGNLSSDRKMKVIISYTPLN